MAITLASVGKAALNISLMIVAVVFSAASVYMLIRFYINYKKYRKYRCVIFDVRSGNKIRFDDAGIFIKNKNKRLWLKNNKVGLSCDFIPSVAGKKTDYVFLMQTGLKNFRYINPNFKAPAINFLVGEEDVNWATAEFDGVVKKFSTKWLEKYLPFIIWGFSMVIILIIFIYFFKEFGVMKDVALAFQEAAKSLSLAKSGTTVITP